MFSRGTIFTGIATYVDARELEEVEEEGWAIKASCSSTTTRDAGINVTREDDGDDDLG